MPETHPRIFGGRYRVLELLGSGGMANVYRARDANLEREVAVKVLRDPLADDVRFQEHFLREARAAANLSHPNIVTIFDFGQEQAALYIVMEYIRGTDLKTYIRRRGRLGVEEGLQLMIKICQGVGYAHRAGIVHCDLKPQNILITPDGSAKITDFGIARALATISPDEQWEVVWGSPQYFAPEQAAGGPPSTASDVYSLGVMLYEMLTGQLPFSADDPEALAEAHLTSIPTPPRNLNPAIIPELEQVLLKLLSKEPSARYRTADQLGRIITTLVTHPEEIAPDAFSTSPEPSREATVSMTVGPLRETDWLAVALGLIAFLAVGGLIPLWLWVCLLYPACPLGAGG